MNVLIIDDEADIVLELREYINRRGHKAIGVDGIEQAFQLLAGDISFDLVLADMRMPRGTGEDVLRHCTRFLSPCPALIVMTGLADDADIKGAHDYGALAVLHKPLTLKQIDEALRLAKQHVSARTSESSPPPRSHLRQDPVYDGAHVA